MSAVPSAAFAAALLPLIAAGAWVKEGQASPPVEIQMRNVNLHLDNSIILEIRRLRGAMIPTRPAAPVSLDDPRSFVTRINSAEIAISTLTLSKLLNGYVFAYPGAPLKNIVATADHGRIKQKGLVRKGVEVPFEIEGSLDATPEGEIRFHADKIASAGIPIKGLLHLFGSNLSRLVKTKQDRGVTIQGDDIILDPAKMLPPPQISGKITAVHIEGDRIVQTFQSGDAKNLTPPRASASYIYHRGGVLRFGKLTMSDTDLEIVNASPGPWFNFSLPRYNEQLVAGYSKSTEAHGLIVFMPDLLSLPKVGAPRRDAGRQQ
jgi:hypothetical protein